MITKCRDCEYYSRRKGTLVGLCYWLGKPRISSFDICEEGFLRKKNFAKAK